MNIINERLKEDKNQIQSRINEIENKYYNLPEKKMEYERLKYMEELNNRYFSLFTEKKIEFELSNAGYSTTNRILSYNRSTSAYKSLLFDASSYSFSTGNVGIGITSPGVKFINAGGTNTSGPTLGSGTVGSQALLSANGLYGMYSGVSSSGDVWHQVQRNDGVTSVYNLLLQPSGGNVGIGTTSPSEKLNISGGTFRLNGSNANSKFFIYPDYSSGAVGVSMVNNSNVSVIDFNSNVGSGVFAGNVTAAGFFNSSDIRLKEVVDIVYDPSEISAITYKWKDGADDKNHVGYSAQEVQKYMPDAVNEDEKGFLSVDYIQVLVAKIDALEKRVKELEGK
jgi:hypothetical protein